MKTLGDKIRTLYIEQNLTQRKLAEKVGIAYQNINGIINNRQNPSPTTLRKIATVLGVTVEYLLPKDIETYPPPQTTGEKIQFLCQKKCIKKIELAKMSGLNYDRVLNIINGKSKYKYSTLEKIAKALGVSVKYLDPNIKNNQKKLSIVGRRIKEICDEKNISQTMLAKKLGLTRQAVSDIIYSENVNHREATLQKIADALEVSVRELLLENNNDENL